MTKLKEHSREILMGLMMKSTTLPASRLKNDGACVGGEVMLREVVDEASTIAETHKKADMLK